MAEKKKVVVLIPGFPKDEADTSCLPFQFSFIKHLCQLSPDTDVTVLSLHYPYKNHEYRIGGIPVISFNGRNKRGIYQLLLRRRVMNTLKRMHYHQKIDILVSFWCGECALLGKKFASANKIKHYCWLMGQDAKRGNKYVRKINPEARDMIALSPFLQSLFEKNYAVRPKAVIMPGVDPDIYSFASHEKDIDLLATGSLIPLKQFEVFIRIVAAIRETLPSVKAVLIGDGPERLKLLSLVHKLGLSSHILFAGELPHKSVLEYMQRAKLFIHPSSYEGFGVVCLEALFAKTTVVSFVNPVQRSVENWHTVDTESEMIKRVKDLLSKQKEVLPPMEFTIHNTVKNFISFAGL